MTQRSTGTHTATQRAGLLSRLRTDVSGNVLAMTAAAVFPMIGLVGGALDMSRLYIVKTRLQAACDAGSLSGRRVMNNGLWNTASQAAANKMFTANFAAGQIGTTGLTKSFSESDGNVTGTASATVPMTLMKVFGQSDRVITVSCEAQMKIPNTDLMFVLDVTGSMAQTIPGDTVSKIDGIKVATKCFYEILANENVDDVTPAQCSRATDPSGGVPASTQLRFGFVPYDQMVNVGRLLPTQYVVDSAKYQSREAIPILVQTWTLGTESGKTWPASASSYTPSTTPASYYNILNTSVYNTPANLGSSGTQTINGVVYNRRRTGMTSSTCAALNTLAGSGGGMLDLEDTQSSTTLGALTDTTNNPPVYPAAIQNLTYDGTSNRTVNGYRYVWSSPNCNLQRATPKSTYARTTTNVTSTKPINWTARTTVDTWTYQQRTLDVSGLKSGTNWNASVSLPITQTNSSSVKRSGSNTSETLKLLANTTVSWSGCIEEAKTWRNVDGDPSNDEWPRSIEDAYDMYIDLIPDPGNDDTRWKPLLRDAVWGRHDGTSYTRDPLTVSANGTWNLGRQFDYSGSGCPAAASKLREYRSGAGAFKTYVNGLNPGNNTYHDIGLLWGARLMSPDGIFGAENQTTPSGAPIVRNMVFMTDGETVNDPLNYTSYGIDWWDRRQTPEDIVPTATMLQNGNDARSRALCTAIKNKNITLWVVFYGTTNTATEARLRACASSSSHFFLASNTPALITAFNKIAKSIAELRLVS